MKLSYASILFFFIAASTSATEVVENEEGFSLFGRSNLFSNALCLPLLDGCRVTSPVESCTSNGKGCLYGGVCARTTAGGKVCVTEAVGDGATCSNTRDCNHGQVCVKFGSCIPNGCFTQIRIL